MMHPRGSGPTRVVRAAVLGMAAAIVLLAGTAWGAAPSPWPSLTPEETALWTAQGVHTPARHLDAQAEVRRLGGVTRLRVVALLIQFPDALADQDQHPPSYYQDLLFSRGVRPSPSVADFLYESSHGRLILEGVVKGWYTAAHEKGNYTLHTGGLGFYPYNTQRVAEEAFVLADPTVNYAKFDNEGADGVPDSGDDDEVVDGLIIIHQGSGREGGSNPDEFLSVHWWTPEPVRADGVFGRFFTMNPEDAPIGIFLHELGHLLGLPDLYDQDGGSFATGVWSIMSAGTYLGGGTQPSDFDAWSKARLGFVDVVQVLADAQGLVIPPSVNSGKIYRLWPSGGSTEYFLLENRQRAGLDAALPGSGLLIYHVDDRVLNNNDPAHYHVAIEQADGLYQLENRYGSPSEGDPGDPYQPGEVFGRYTDPGSQGYDGRETDIAVYDIRDPRPDGTLTASLVVQPGPLVELSDIVVTELEGNGDGFLTAGEVAGISPRLGVQRLPAGHVVLTLVSLDPLGDMREAVIPLGTVNPGDVPVVPPQQLRIASSLPTDPYPLPLAVTITWDNAPARRLHTEIGVGTVFGRYDDFENPRHGWSAEPARPSSFSQWIYGPHFGTEESAGFKHGFTQGYRRGCDAILESPSVLLPAGAVLIYDQRVDIFQPEAPAVLAAGVLEISTNGGDWRPLTPDGGYPVVYTGANPSWQGRRVFAGTLRGGAYHEVRADLSAYRGMVRIRFRFYSETETTAGTGWWIDNVRIQSEPTPVRLLAAAAVAQGDDIALSWELADPLPAALRWRRGPDPEGGAVVGEGWRPATAQGVVLDVGAAVLGPADYWLEAQERDGRVERRGPWRAVPGGGEPRWRVVANPARGRVEFVWTATLPGSARLEIFDVRGARVRVATVGGGALSYVWDGRDDATLPTPPGIYFARISESGLPPLRLTRLP